MTLSSTAKANRVQLPLEGPFSFRCGRVVYYDRGVGKYYDRSTDIFLTDDEAFQLGRDRGLSGSV